MSDIRLILMQIFNRDIYRLGAVINYGVMEGDLLVYLTREGKKSHKISEFDPVFKVIKFEEIDLKASLYDWFRKNQSSYEKPIVVDYNLAVGEVYQGSNVSVPWYLPIMIDKSGPEIRVKPLYE